MAYIAIAIHFLHPFKSVSSPELAALKHQTVFVEHTHLLFHFQNIYDLFQATQTFANGRISTSISQNANQT